MALPGDSEAGKTRDVLDAAIAGSPFRNFLKAISAEEFSSAFKAMSAPAANIMAAFDPPGNPFTISS